MKDLSDRFAQGEDAPKAEARPDPMARLLHEPPEEPVVERAPTPGWLVRLRERADLIAAVCAVLAAGLMLWPLFHPVAVVLPTIAQTGDEMAVVTVHAMTEGGVAKAPDWAGLFNAYQLETSLRDISIRCTYGLPVDARVDRYLHAPLPAGTQIRVFLADPGMCPKL
jgi:hypothetical protein